MKTDHKHMAWARRYQRAMCRHLQQGPSPGLRPALTLGRQAVKLGLETLGMARIHEQAMSNFVHPEGSTKAAVRKLDEQARSFFAEVMGPLEATHHPALKAGIRIDRQTQTLQRRTDEACASVAPLKRAIAQRQAAEEKLKQLLDLHAKLLAEAHDEQKRSRHLTHALLSAHEGERDTTGRELRNEVAQALVAIDLNLLTLGISATANTEKLEKKVANAQRLVRESLAGEGA